MDASLAQFRTKKAGSHNAFYKLGTCLMVLALLYFGRPVLLPVALSVLIAFVLTPLVYLLERWRLGRIPSVLAASGLAFALIGLSAWALVSQLHGLAADLPSHRMEIKNKISSLSVGENSTLSRLMEMFDDVLGNRTQVAGNMIEGDAADASAATGLKSQVPQTIVIRADESSQLSKAIEILLPIVEPLASAALVIVLVMFLLIRREDVRFRMISLMGDSALTGTTRLMSDTAERVSSYLLNLLLVNAGFGLLFGIGLYLLGVPYAALWGFLTLCFRFIPFLGSPASVLFPLLISFATSEGWSQTISVAIFFVVAELITNNVIEPIIFGKSTGLTPIALLVAALFWAWLWGPIGLLLSTPLTVCLVVLGQHLPQLRSLKVLLAEQPVLDARLQYFQRLLAGDQREAARVFDEYVKGFGQDRAFDEVVIPALKVTRRERDTGVITSQEQRFIWDSIRTSVLHNDASSTVPSSDLKIYGYPVHDPAEEIMLAMLNASLGSVATMKRLTTKHLPNRAIEEIVEQQPTFVVLSLLPPGGLRQTTFICRQLKEKCPSSRIVVLFGGKPKNYDELLVKLRESGASYLTTSIEQTKKQIIGSLDDLLPKLNTGAAVGAGGKLAEVPTRAAVEDLHHA